MTTTTKKATKPKKKPRKPYKRARTTGLNEKEVKSIRKLSKSGRKHMDIAKLFKIHPSHVSRIVHRHIWTSV